MYTRYFTFTLYLKFYTKLLINITIPHTFSNAVVSNECCYKLYDIKMGFQERRSISEIGTLILKSFWYSW